VGHLERETETEARSLPRATGGGAAAFTEAFFLLYFFPLFSLFFFPFIFLFKQKNKLGRASVKMAMSSVSVEYYSPYSRTRSLKE
jgi:hypothetical protein